MSGWTRRDLFNTGIVASVALQPGGARRSAVRRNARARVAARATAARFRLAFSSWKRAGYIADLRFILHLIFNIVPGGMLGCLQ